MKTKRFTSTLLAFPARSSPSPPEERIPAIQANIDAVLAAGGIASVYHSNSRWSLDRDIIGHAAGESLLEVYNGQPFVNIYGGPGKPSNEQIWDNALRAGKLNFGVDTDDSHNYPDFSPGLSNHRRGWVMIRGTQHNQETVMEALFSGNFYASAGGGLSLIGVVPREAPSKD